MQFQNLRIHIAVPADVPAITSSAQHGLPRRSFQKGWTTEEHLIGGDTRSTPELTAETMNEQGSVFLKYVEKSGEITGCVNLQQQGERIYLGMFSVSPQRQGAGIGKEILKAAEEYTRFVNCRIIYMSVISVRSELIDWYKRHGYADTGIRKPFIEDGITGKHKMPLEFMYLEKNIN
ncbi:MAG: GNAT family N-acetyltransferase [Chitinophagaceae bacterium]|nr:GNAT family N-acetyltransferase [Chitinophagaceae bacterium]